MNTSSRRRRSLLDKVSGPNAVSISGLVERGEAASHRMHEKFDDFLKLRVNELERMLCALASDASAATWKSFYTIVHDIRGSGALAGNLAVTEFCFSLERLLEERDPADIRMATAVASHVNALSLVVSQGAPDKASQGLLVAELSRAIECLPLKKATFRS